MATYIAFLRAVNLGRTRKLPMADARSWLGKAGFEQVETYIQTGNVRLTTSLRSRAKVERLVEEVLAEACGFDVPTLAFTPAELRGIHAHALTLPAPDGPEVRRYVTFLKEEPGPVAAAPVDGWAEAGEAARVQGRAVHWWIDGPSRGARLSNARLEKLVGVGTTRDLKVVTTLAQRWGG